MRDLLHSITLIDPLVLKYPEMKNHCSVAQRMSWASKRETTRPEDEAYSLMGLFSVNMPLLYGEGGEKAFLRLQKEILKDSTDHSLFTWTKISENTVNLGCYGGFLAYSPREFAECGEIGVPWREDPLAEDEPYDMTNVGLRIRLPVMEVSDSYHIALLNCNYSNHDDDYLGICLSPGKPGRDDEKFFARQILRKPFTVRVGPRRIGPFGDTQAVFAQAPGDCLREARFRMMYFGQFRCELVD